MAWSSKLVHVLQGATCSGQAPACDQIEGFDLRVEDFDVLLALAPDFAFRYDLAGLYRLVKLVTVNAANLIGILGTRLALTCIRPANAGGSKIEGRTALSSFQAGEGGKKCQDEYDTRERTQPTRAIPGEPRYHRNSLTLKWLWHSDQQRRSRELCSVRGTTSSTRAKK